MAERQGGAIGLLLVCAALWGFWWFPVGLFERAGLTGPWIGLAMSAAALPVAGAWWLVQRGAVSSRAVLGAAMVGLAITLYAMAASYTDFIRAVLLFYLAPAWSTLIEIGWLGRRWSVAAGAAIALSTGGVLLISQGALSFDGLGAVGDWMALGSGLSWSIGVALIFKSRRAEVSAVFSVSALGGVAAALAIAALDGSLMEGLPDVGWIEFAEAGGFAALYMGTIMAGTLWGAFRLPPAVMTYLLSIEVVGGVVSSALILEESFGWQEIGGAICILAAVAVEVISARRSAPPRNA